MNMRKSFNHDGMEVKQVKATLNKFWKLSE